jgi:hypothetical protein
MQCILVRTGLQIHNNYGFGLAIDNQELRKNAYYLMELTMNREQLIVAMNHGNAIFQQLERRYPSLKGYLVYASRFGQCDLTDSMERILSEFPNMIYDSKAKIEAFQWIKKSESVEQVLKKRKIRVKTIQ